MYFPDGAVERIEDAGRAAIARMSEEDWLDDDVILIELNGLMSIASKEITGSAFVPPQSHALYATLEQLAYLGLAELMAEVHVRRVAAAGNSEMLNRTQPAPQPYGVSPRGAELLAAEWLQYLGAIDVQVTRASQDGGIDVTTASDVAQVKAWAGPVTVQEVRELAGVSAHDGRRAIFFATTGYTEEAQRFGEAVGMLLFVLNAEDGTLAGITGDAQAALVHGLQ